MRQLYGWLTVGFFLSGVAAGVGGYVFLRSSHTVDVGAEVGKWLLTVAVAFVVTGALSMVVKQIDQRRSERSAWHAVLDDLVAAHQTVMVARLRLAAQRSALTYHEQLGQLVGARAEIRRLRGVGTVIRDPSLREHIDAMRRYLDALGAEYEKGYLAVARQQRLDELWLTDQMKAASDGADGPVLPARLAEPTGAWRMLQDPVRFPRLAALIDADAFRIDTFHTHYKRVKGCLEIHAGVGTAPAYAWKDPARKLADRARDFVTLHNDVPDDVKARVAKEARQVEDACDHRDPDPRAIEAAMINLREAAADAVRAVYPEPEVIAVTEPTPAAEETKEHPAASP